MINAHIKVKRLASKVKPTTVEVSLYDKKAQVNSHLPYGLMLQEKRICSRLKRSK